MISYSLNTLTLSLYHLILSTFFFFLEFETLFNILQINICHFELLSILIIEKEDRAGNPNINFKLHLFRNNTHVNILI